MIDLYLYVDVIFEVVDKDGRKIKMTRERWSHIAINHPDMVNKIEEIKSALIKPTLIVPNKYSDDKRNYYKYQKPTSDYILVIVKYLNQEGYVVSAFSTSKLVKR